MLPAAWKTKERIGVRCMCVARTGSSYEHEPGVASWCSLLRTARRMAKTTSREREEKGGSCTIQ